MSVLGRKRKVDSCPNRLFLSYLDSWKAEAAEKESKAYHTYNKAYKSLLKYPLPLQNGKEAIILESFGNKICSMLDSKLSKEASEKGMTPQELLEESRCVPDSWWQSIENEPKRKKCSTKTNPKSEVLPKKRTYIPSKNSGAYAILLALYKNLQKPNSNGFMKKDELQREAQPYANKSFTVPDHGSHYTAWSSMATLLDKELVKKHSNPAKFEITSEGIELAEMIEAGNSRRQDENIPPESRGISKKPVISCSTNVWELSKSNDDLPAMKKVTSESSAQLKKRCHTESTKIDLLCTNYNKVVTQHVEKIDLTLTSSDEESSLNVKNINNSQLIRGDAIDSLTNFSQSEIAISHDKDINVEAHKTTEFTLNPEDFYVILCVDSRELSGGDSRKGELQRQLDKLGVKYVERVLQIGDFVWIAQEKQTRAYSYVAKELVLDYVIERKCMSDLAQSIRDGRFHEQKIRLKQCGVKNIIYLVEDLNQIQHQSLPEKSLRQALINTEIVDSIFVKYSKNMASTAQYLKTMTDKLTRMYTPQFLKACDIGHVQGQDLKSFPNCDLLTFRDFNEQSMKSKGLAISAMFVRQLMQIHGMSCDKAQCIARIYPTPMILRQAYFQCTSIKEKEAMLSKIKFGLLNRNLGISLSRCVYHLFVS